MTMNVNMWKNVMYAYSKVYEQCAPVIIIRSKYVLCLMLQYLHKCVKNQRPIKPFEKYFLAFMAACCLAHRTIAKGLLS